MQALSKMGGTEGSGTDRDKSGSQETRRRLVLGARPTVEVTDVVKEGAGGAPGWLSRVSVRLRLRS